MGKYSYLILFLLPVKLIAPSSFLLCEVVPFFQQVETADLVVTGRVRQFNYHDDSSRGRGFKIEVLHWYKGELSHKFIQVVQRTGSPAFRQGVYKPGTTWVMSLQKHENNKYILNNCAGLGPLLAEKGYVYGCIQKECDKFGNKKEKMTHREFSRQLLRFLEKQQKP